MKRFIIFSITALAATTVLAFPSSPDSIIGKLSGSLEEPEHAVQEGLVAAEFSFASLVQHTPDGSPSESLKTCISYVSNALEPDTAACEQLVADIVEDRGYYPDPKDRDRMLNHVDELLLLLIAKIDREND